MEHKQVRIRADYKRKLRRLAESKGIPTLSRMLERLIDEALGIDK